MGEVKDELRRLAEAIRVSTQHSVERRRKTGNLVAVGAIGLVVLWFLVAILGLIAADPRYGEMRKDQAALENKVRVLSKQVQALRAAMKPGRRGGRRGGAADKAPRTGSAPAEEAAEAAPADPPEAAAARAPATRFVRVTQDNVNIRGEPALGAMVIGKAAAGDVFELERQVEDWYAVSMFSGEDRYIHGELAEAAAGVPPLPRSEETRSQVCKEILEGQRRAAAEAERRYPESGIERLDHQRLLTDRLILEAYQRHEVPPARRGQVTALCARTPPDS